MKESDKDQMERWYVWLLFKRINQKLLSLQIMISHRSLGQGNNHIIFGRRQLSCLYCGQQGLRGEWSLTPHLDAGSSHACLVGNGKKRGIVTSYSVAGGSHTCLLENGKEILGHSRLIWSQAALMLASWAAGLRVSSISVPFFQVHQHSDFRHCTDLFL